MSSLPPNLDPNVCWIEPEDKEEDIYSILDNDGKVDIDVYESMKNVTPDDRFRKNWSRADKPYLRTDTTVPGAAQKFWVTHRHSPLAMNYFHSKKDGKPRVELSKKLKLKIPAANSFPEHASPIKLPKPTPTLKQRIEHQRLFPELYALDDELDLSELDKKMPANPSTTQTETKKPNPTTEHENETSKSL